MADLLSASQIVQAMFENARNVAQERQEEYRESAGSIESSLSLLNGKVPGYRKPIEWVLPANSIDWAANAYITGPNAIKIDALQFDTYKARLEAAHDKTVERILAIYNEFLPEGGLLDEGPLKGLLLDQLNGTGIDPSTEAARIAKTRNQIISEGQTAQREAMASFAARRFPIPPGAMVAALHAAQIGMQTRIAGLSDTLAAERAQVEAQHRRDVFELLVQLRLAVIQAAGDLMQTVVGLMQAGTTDILSAEKYNMDVHKLRMAWIKRVQEEQKFQTWGRQDDNATSAFELKQRQKLNEELVLNKKIELLTGEAQALSAQLASVLNSVNGSAGLSAGASTTVGYTYGNDTESAPPPLTSI